MKNRALALLLCLILLCAALPASALTDGELQQKLDAAFDKEPSFDFICAPGNKGISGYDLVTKLGSNLTFTGQTAKLEERGRIEIVRQNFGFDPVNGITKVELDMNEPHYFLEVRTSKEN